MIYIRSLHMRWSFFMLKYKIDSKQKFSAKYSPCIEISEYRLNDCIDRIQN